jgi:hypothetical protein
MKFFLQKPVLSSSPYISDALIFFSIFPKRNCRKYNFKMLEIVANSTIKYEENFFPISRIGSKVKVKLSL